MEAPLAVTVAVARDRRAAAIAFYAAVFGGEPLLEVHVLEGEPAGSRAPVCELVVDDVEAWIDRGIRYGAELRTRVDAPDGRATYAQWRDPFGALWAFTRSP